MITYKKPEITIISPVNNYRLICNYKNPICNRKSDWIRNLEDIETQYSKNFMHMKIIKTMRQMIEKILGKDLEKYRENLQLVMKNLYDMER
jgi:hypothetical protein